MIKELTSEEMASLRANVTLRNGLEYLGCDIPRDPFVNSPFVMFWHDNAAWSIPSDRIASFVLYVDKKD